MNPLTPDLQQLVSSSDGLIRAYVSGLIRKNLARAQYKDDLIQEGFKIACLVAAEYDQTQGEWAVFLNVHLRALAKTHRDWANPIKTAVGYLPRGELPLGQTFEPRTEDRLAAQEVKQAMTLEADRPRDMSMFLAHLEGQTFEEIGSTWGVTRERVRQVFQKLLPVFDRLRAEA